MEKELIHGKMVENILGITRKIRNVDGDNIIGLMEEYMKVNGKMDKETEKELLLILVDLNKAGFGVKIEE